MNATEEKAQQINGVGTEASSNRASSGVNESETNPKSGTPVTQRRSGPVRYELVDKDGEILIDRNLDGYALGVKRFTSAVAAAAHAKMLWPDQEQGEDRTGKGWDVQVAGCE